MCKFVKPTNLIWYNKNKSTKSSVYIYIYIIEFFRAIYYKIIDILFWFTLIFYFLCYKYDSILNLCVHSMMIVLYHLAKTLIGCLV